MKRLKEFKVELEKLTCDKALAEKIFALMQKWEAMEAKERKIKQLEGIERARSKGVSMGRPRIKEPEQFEKICKRFFNHEISAVVAAEACGMGVSTFYRRIRKIKEARGKGSED